MRRGWVRSPAHEVAVAALVAARHAAGLSQRDVATRLGKPPSFVAKIEAGSRSLGLLDYIAIARVMGLDEADLLRSIIKALPATLDI